MHYIDKFIKKHDLEHSYYDIDPDWLLTSDAEDYLHQSQCSQSEMLPHMKLQKNCYSALEALEYLNTHQVDLIFLDINYTLNNLFYSFR